MTLESIAWRGTHIELPPGRDVVLVYGPQLQGLDGKPIAFAWFDHVMHRWLDVRGPSFPNLSAVTHWAELPTGADP